MRPYKGFILDDEPRMIDELKKKLMLHKEILEITHTAFDLEQSRLILAKEKFDISFLDIEIGHENCFKLFNTIPLDRFGVIVLNTKHEEFKLPIKNIPKLHHFIPLFKPYSNGKIAAVIAEFKQLIAEEKQIRDVSKIAIKTDKGLIILNLMELAYIETVSAVYVNYYVFDADAKKLQKPVLERKTISELMNFLPNYFFKIRRSCIVNTNFIYEMKKPDTIILSCLDSFGNRISKKAAFEKYRNLENIQSKKI